MKKEFEIEIQEVLSRIQKVEANSLDEAIKKVMHMYHTEQIILEAEDMKEVEFYPYSDT